MKITSITCVYNEATTVARVLEVLLRNKDIEQVIVVDNKSTDHSVEVITPFENNKKALFIRNSRNLGKGGSVVKALNATVGDTILMCDADLTKIQNHHIENIIGEYKTGKHDMIIAAREKEESRIGIKRFIQNLSGERMFGKDAVKDFHDLIKTNGYGFEQITNFVHRNKRVRTIVSKDIGHVMKHQRDDKSETVQEFIEEFGNLVKTDAQLRAINLKRRFKLEMYVSANLPFFIVHFRFFVICI